MIIQTNLQQRVVTFSLSGHLDTQTVALLRQETQKIDFSRLEEVVFDLRDLEYISSAGLRELVTVRKKFRTSDQVRLLHVNEDVMEVLKTTGIQMFFTITRADAENRATYIHLSYKELLAKRLQASSDRVFLIGDRSYTWRDIEVGAQLMAMDLYRSGVRKGSHVAICGANSINWVLCFFAVQKLGAIAALVNYNLSLRELVTLSQIGDITHLCCGEAPAATDFDAFSAAITGDPESMVMEVYDIRNSVDVLARAEEYGPIAGNFDGKVGADDVAVMIFTSGSTGRPKGVLLSAYNVLNASWAHMQSIHQDQADKACLILPLFHIFGLLSGLCTGMLAGSSVVIPRDLRTGTILSAVRDQQCTILHSVPTMMLALVNNKAFSSDQVASLRSTILAGASISQAQILMLQEKFPNNHFSISYGLSEMAPITVTDYDDTIDHITQTVGKPVANIELCIQDPVTGSDCAPGERGQVLVRGYNLMTCYYKLDLEDQAVDDEGWLYTGDLGFLDAQGYLHLAGRLKELIIRGGENIIPNEVAAAISQHKSIADVKVLGIPDPFYGEIVAAALVLKAGCAFDREEMVSFLAARLAKFKIPAHFAVYEALPALSNGKVDAVSLKQELTARFSVQ